MDRGFFIEVLKVVFEDIFILFISEGDGKEVVKYVYIFVSGVLLFMLLS